MYKKKLVNIIILFGLILLASCGSTSEDYESEQYVPPEITFVAPTGVARELHGTEIMAVAGVRRYQFQTTDEEYNLALASYFENVVYMFSDILDTDRQLQTIITQDPKRYAVRTVMGENLIVNPYDSATHGWFVYSMTLGRIPMWLAAGIEMVARGIDFDYPLGELCEMHFAPFSWGTPAHHQSISTAYHFVHYLIDRDYLATILNLYITEERLVTDLYVAGLFYLFSGYTLDTSISLHFSGSSFNITTNTNMANYVFQFPELHYQLEWPDTHFEVWQFIRLLYDIDYIDRTRLTRITDYLDNAISFVKNWHGQFADFGFEPIRTYIPMDIHFAARANHGQMIIPINGLSMIAAHEAAHVISREINGGFSAFAPFEEGLAQTLQFLYDLHDRNGFGWAYQFWPIWVESFIPFDYEIGIFECYAIADTVRNFLLQDYEHYAYYQHFLAYTALNIPGLGAASPDFRQWAGGFPAEIHSYVASRSFVRYLIETYGVESYLHVHFDENLFEYVYGMTLREMVYEWMDFLSVTAEEFLNAAIQAQE